VGKRKRKPKEQPLFIHFVNSKLEREDVFDLIDRVAKIPAFVEWKNIDYLKESIDINRVKKYKPKDKNLFELRKKFNVLKSKEEIFFRLDNKDRQEKEEIKEKLWEIEDGPTFLKELDMGIYLALGFFNNLKHFQVKLKGILEKVIGNEKPDTDLFAYHYTAISAVFYPGDEGYLKKRFVPGHINFTDEDDIRYGNLYWDEVMNIIFYDMTEFLCTSKWKNLIKCKECGRFWEVDVPWQKFCKFRGDKCRNDYNYKKDTKSGKRKEYMKKRYDEGLDQ
jgi:hypothetical protein